MSTRARIGVLRPDGRVESIYNHFDGYIDNGLGDVLDKYYRDPQILDKLLALGDRSSLYDEKYDNNDDLYGAKEYPSRFDDNEDAFYNNDDDWDIEYKYLFKNGDWYANGYDGERVLDKFKPGKAKQAAVNAIINPSFGGKVKRFKSATEQADSLIK